MGITDHPTARRSFLYYFNGTDWEEFTGQLDAGGATPIVTNATGIVNINLGYAPAAAFWLESVTCHLSGVPVTAEDFTVVLDARDGAAYDTLLYSVDPSVFGAQDLDYVPEGGRLLCEAGDAIRVIYPNSDGNTFGARIVARLA